MTFENKFRNFVGRMPNLEKNEMIIIARELLEELNKEQIVVIDSWKGKSSLDIENIGDIIHVKKYQKPEKGEEEKEVNYEIKVEELNQLKKVISHLMSHIPEKIMKSTEIAEVFYGKQWNEIFSDRKTHNHFTIMLNVLDKQDFIEYRGGKVYGNKME